MPDLVPLPFLEAIAWARSRRVVLPEVYYGQLQGLARAQAFTISGLAGLEQIQGVVDRLTAALESGETFGAWQARVIEEQQLIDLSPARMETIFRNTIQQSYNRGRYEQQARVVDDFPYYLYDAVNDSRTRPAHAVMDGMVARHDDPIWDTWTPACGHRCRCKRVALTERQAARLIAEDQARLAERPELASQRATAQPDPGWGQNIYRDPNAGLKEAIARRRAKCVGQGGQLALPGAADWCRHPALVDAWDAMERALDRSEDQLHLLREVLEQPIYERLAERSRAATGMFGLTEPQGVILSGYTDRDLPVWPLANALARELPHESPLRLTEREMYRAGIMILVMDAALERLPGIAGIFRRGVSSLDMPGELRARFLAAHRPGVVVEYDGYTSLMAGTPYRGDIQQEIATRSARDLGAFSLAGEAELLLPRQTAFLLSGVERRAGDFALRAMLMTETQHNTRKIPARRKFAAGEPGRARQLLEDVERRRREGPAATQAELDRYERMQGEAGGPIPARFKDLQHLNEPLEQAQNATPSKTP